jgi:nitrogen regulatory protein PII
MKRIETLIHPNLWDDARAVLETLGASVTLREVKTFGRSLPKREVYRGSAYVVDISAELELTILVEDAFVESTILALETIEGKGEIVVSSVDAIVRFGEQRSMAATPVAAPATAKRAGTIPLHTAPAHA